MSVGVGGNYSKSQTGSSSRNYPLWAQSEIKQLAPALGGALNAYDPSGGAERTAAIDELMRNVTGAYTDPNQNKSLQEVFTGMRNQANTYDLPKIQQQTSQAAQGGGNLFSSAAQKAGGAASERYLSDMSKNMANMSYQDQQAERGRQYGATNQLINLGPEQLNQALAMISALKGLETKGKQNQQGFGVSGSASYSM